MCTLWMIYSVVALLSCSSPDENTEPPLPGDGEKPEQPVNPEPEKKPLYEWTSEDLIQTVEAENGTYTEARPAKDKAGYSGTGYLTGFWSDKASVTVTVSAPERAMYRIKMDYLAEGGNSHGLIINNKKEEASKFSIPVSKGFQSQDMGKYLLEKGTNTITFQAEWGDVLIDRFSVYTAVRNQYNIAPQLVDKAAAEPAKKLYQYLLDNFGKKIISGYLDGKNVDGVTDCKPALYGWDFHSYTEGYPYHWVNGGHAFGAEDNGNVQAAIDWYTNSHQNGIVTFHWHWAAPSGSKPGVNTFYTENTTFSVSKAVQPGTEENRLILRDIDAIAVQQKKLEAAGVAVLWRPLHEANGGWFWWGAEGAEPCLKLYDILFDRLMNHHQIHNLIWVWSCNGPEWYPGNEKVDMIGHDSYPGNYNTGVQSFMFNNLYQLTGGKKIIAMTENGPIPDPDAALEQDAPWALFMSWGDLLYEQNTADHIKEVFHNKNVITVHNK